MGGIGAIFSGWYSQRLEHDVGMARWGHWGVPVLLFPTAGGDAGEIERMGLIGALAPQLEAGRIKVYSCDSVAGSALARGEGSPEHRCWLFKQFGEYVRRELVPAIHADCRGERDIVAAGASIGAFNALGVLCRYPDAFCAAIGMSGTYDLTGLLGYAGNEDYHLSAPSRFLPQLEEGAHLQRLRTRLALLVHGRGRWEEPGQSWRMAEALGARGVPNRVDEWGDDYDHDWASWHRMLPPLLDEIIEREAGVHL